MDLFLAANLLKKSLSIKLPTQAPTAFGPLSPSLNELSSTAKTKNITSLEDVSLKKIEDVQAISKEQIGGSDMIKKMSIRLPQMPKVESGLSSSTKDETRLPSTILAKSQSKIGMKNWEDVRTLMQQKSFSNLSKIQEGVPLKNVISNIAAEQDQTLVKNEIIKLNVGGKHFDILSTTLLKYPKSKFYVWLGSTIAKLPKDQYGRYFIDRNSDYFNDILYYLRNNDFLSISIEKNEALLREAQFYNIEPMIQRLEKLQEKKMGGISSRYIEQSLFVKLGGSREYSNFREGLLEHLKSILSSSPTNADEYDFTNVWLNLSIALDGGTGTYKPPVQDRLYGNENVYNHYISELAFIPDKHEQNFSRLRDQKLLLIYLTTDLTSEGFSVEIIEKMNETSIIAPRFGIRFCWENFKYLNTETMGGCVPTDRLINIDSSINSFNIKLTELSYTLSDTLTTLQNLIRNSQMNKVPDPKITLEEQGESNCIIL
ncbi:unnamed protein product [Gordionus sp. m RMFG-2023]